MASVFETRAKERASGAVAQGSKSVFQIAAERRSLEEAQNVPTGPGGLPSLDAIPGVPQATEPRQKRGFMDLFKDANTALNESRVQEQENILAASPGVNRAAVKALPFAGDAALTALAPQIGLPLKAARGAKIAASLFNVGSKVVGATAGGAGGEFIKQKIEGDTDQQKLKREATISAVSETGLQAIAKTGKFLGGKLRGVSGLAFDVLTDFTGISKVLSRRAEDALSTARNKVIGDSTQRAVDFSSKLGGAPLEDVGLDVRSVLKGKLDFEKVYKDPNEITKLAALSKGDILLDDAQQTFGELVESFATGSITTKKGFDVPVSADQAVTNALKWLGIKSASPEGRFLREFVRGPNARPNDVNFIAKQIWKSKPGDPKRVVEWKEAFKRDIVEDVQRGLGKQVDFEGSLAKADKIFGDTNNWFRENPVAKKITNKMNPENVVGGLSKLSADQLKSFKAGIIKEPGGKEAWAGFELQFIQNLIKPFIKESDDVGVQVLTKPAALSRGINEAKNKILAINPKAWPALKKEADFYAKNAPRFAELKVNSGMDLFTAWGVLSPGSKQALKSFFTSEAIPQTARGLSKIGLRLGGQQLQLGGQ